MAWTATQRDESGSRKFTENGGSLTWLHANGWLKPLFMRLPARLLLGRQQRTGVVVLSPDGRRPLYEAMYKGPLLASIASAVPAISSGFIWPTNRWTVAP